ncbi:hypothetical protein P8452_16473 [Trifolium repens]|jgi:hypothetical protein|nr:hypothetical protein P8452_16473 [Trifolium repens]
MMEDLFPSPKRKPSFLLQPSSSSSPSSSQTELVKNVVCSKRNLNKSKNNEGSSFDILNYESWISLYLKQ